MSALLRDSESWGLLVGVVLPLLVAVVQQPRWTGLTRVVVGWVCALAAGVVICLAHGVFDQEQTVLRTCILVLVAAQTTHAGWKKAGITTAIEQATSPPPQRR